MTNISEAKMRSEKSGKVSPGCNSHRCARKQAPKPKSRCRDYPPKVAGHSIARACIWQAAKAYGQNYGHALRCSQGESRIRWWVTNNWDVNAANGDPSGGLFQIIPSTYGTTPYGRDVDPRPGVYRPAHPRMSARWNSLAAMWMWSRGRISEWAHPAC